MNNTVHSMNIDVHAVNGQLINRAVACLLIKEVMSNEEIEYNALKLLEANPRLSQRQLSAELDISLGKTHYVLKSLIDVGWVKLNNFRSSNNKLGYAYVLTPSGITEKAAITVRFLARKQREYIELQAEIEALRDEVAAIDEASHCPRRHLDQTD
ncbi:MarR family EPS-associated transcriptional regulator [Pseudomonadales bacterium]|nr:MarR family EPS-associated transcriptional regulator [Pseudomonadales bacterium]